ncbi:MAG: hypothetical protein ACLSG5_06175 [Oscillospiraceae bacterium]
MAGKNVTIQDIADRLGMAKSTVSKALSEPPTSAKRPGSAFLAAQAKWATR